MLRTYASLAAVSALAAMAANTGSGGAAPDPVAKADPAPHPLSADFRAPAEPSPDPGVGPTEGNAPNADPSPPSTAKEASTADKAGGKSKKPKVMVWAQPGHEQIGIGQMFSTPPDFADLLRGAGRARYASDAEVKAAKDAERDVPHYDSV